MSEVIIWWNWEYSEICENIEMMLMAMSMLFLYSSFKTRVKVIHNDSFNNNS